MVKQINAAVFMGMLGAFVVMAIYAGREANSLDIGFAGASFVMWLVNILPVIPLRKPQQ